MNTKSTRNAKKPKSFVRQKGATDNEVSRETGAMKNIEGDHTKFKLLDYKSTGVSFAEYFSCNGVILNGFPDVGKL